MRIDSGSIGMESERTYTQTQMKVQTYSVSVNTNQAAMAGSFGDMLSVVPSSSIATSGSLHDEVARLREEFINLLLRLLFPEKEFSLNERMQNGYANNNNESFGQLISVGRKTEYFYEETESTTFNTKGIVQCSDGRQIEFGLNLNMSREFSEYYSEEIDFVERALTDPLVINFDTQATSLSDQTFYFDIDSDGVEDEISKLIEGSGFLALDKNEDGIINDGSELFGTKSGNGFKDLSIYDTDKDGFIDEDDEIFDKLKIMTVDEKGEQHLYSLKDKNVGAIYLGGVGTQFSLNNLNNETQGIIRSTGVFLFEDGRAGTVQQIDMARRQQLVAAYA